MEQARTSGADQRTAARVEAVYLHARRSAEARVVFHSLAGVEHARTVLPLELQAELQPIDFQALLPTEESSLQPVTLERLREGAVAERVAPALWHVPGVGLPLAAAVPWLATLAVAEADAADRPRADAAGLRYLALASRLVVALVTAGEYTPSNGKGLLRWLPCWRPEAMRCLAALAEIVPEWMLTARFMAAEEPIWAVTPRNLTVSFVGQALDALAQAREGLGGPQGQVDASAAGNGATRLPREFWRMAPVPLLEIVAPPQELEEGAPWALQLLFRPVPGIDLCYSLEELRQRLQRSLFPDALALEAMAELEASVDDVAKRIPVLRRAMNMGDGRASLNRQELDQVLDHLPLLEGARFEVRMPGLAQVHRLSARVELADAPGPDAPAGPRPWFEFQWRLALGEQVLTDDEFEQLVGSRSPLVHLARGAVLLSPKDREALLGFRKLAGAARQRITFFDALRLRLGGATHLHGLALESMETSPRLERMVAALEQARSIHDRELPHEFHGVLRPYQSRGHAWMHYLVEQGFGACLADDMGLGKTVQAIVMILDWRRDPARRGPVLLVCPVSVLGNWRRELQRFAPSLRVSVHHGKGRARDPEGFERVCATHDVILTSYNLLQRDEELLGTRWFQGVALDEAQNIKNPGTRQSRVARQLQGGFRLALTGTPLENRPLDLWSIMDFLNEGLLGKRSEFMQTLEHPIVKQRSRSTMATLARLVRPFVLRRLKTDPEIIRDLPEKSEQIVAATLTREQAVLYESIVRRGLGEIEKADAGMQRRGAILTTLLRLKQVCNHPAHYLMDGSALAGRSGKLDLLVEMLQEALDEGDRCLVFTQFKEMGSLLKAHLEALFGQKLPFLHGGVPQKEREEMVQAFQEGGDVGAKIFVLSLKAGGYGLNLTMANRVFHYDRWWNPAVEDQATDRAFRIGQQRNVFVHKFVCTGTLEERIQGMLERKREVASNLLGSGEGWLTELSNDELRRLIMLDREEAMA